MKFVAILLPILLLTSGCSKDVNSDDLKDDVPYYQYYEVGYDKTGNSTVAAASFRVREKNGTKVELANGASIRANNMTPGEITVSLHRAKNIPVKTEDGNAGGTIQLRLSISKKATLQ